MKIGELTVKVRGRYVISLWDAIKLRIAGENYKIIANKIMEKLEDIKDEN